jgi:hypothetical protein
MTWTGGFSTDSSYVHSVDDDGSTARYVKDLFRSTHEPLTEHFHRALTPDVGR